MHPFLFHIDAYTKPAGQWTVNFKAKHLKKVQKKHDQIYKIINFVNMLK